MSDNITITLTDQAIIGSLTTDTPTSITGLLKGSAGKVAQAVAGTDYAPVNVADNRVRFDADQTLTSPQKAQVAANVGATSDPSTNTLVKRDANGGFDATFIGRVLTFVNGDAFFFNGSNLIISAGTFKVYDDALFDIEPTAKENFREALGSGTTGDALFTAATPSQANVALGVTTRLQTSDSATRNTTTYADSIQLTPITLLAGITYDIHFFVTFSCASTAGIKIGLSCAAFPQVVRMGVLTPTTPATISSSGTFLEVLATNSAFTAGTGIREVQGSFRPTANTTIVMRWATNTTPSGGDTAQILTGTFLRATPIV